MRRKHRKHKIIIWGTVFLLGIATCKTIYAEGASDVAAKVMEEDGIVEPTELIEVTEKEVEDTIEIEESTEFADTEIMEQTEDLTSVVWDGNADTAWYEESKAEFTLSTPQQLAGLAQLVNSGNTFEGKRILLDRDLYFNEGDLRGSTYPSGKKSWTTIADGADNAFEGVFDGQGHVLYSMYSEPLFGTIGEKGIIKAVKTDQGMFRQASIAYENNGWILFCMNNSYILNAYPSEYTGGICVENTNLVYGCGNTGKVMGGDAGGIAGRNRGETASIDSCWNQGEVGKEGYHIGGIVSSNYGWVYDCYNAGTIFSGYRTTGGIVGVHNAGTDSRAKIYNCYNIGEVDAGADNTICGGSEKYCANVYSTPSEYNHSAVEMSREEFRAVDAVSKLQGEKIVAKWCVDKDNLNDGCIIPIAQQDMADGVYKMIPDIWNPITEVSIDLADGEYKLKACLAYYGIDDITPSYYTDSEILSITPEGMITPQKEGEAIVNVIFEENAYGKQSGFDVKITVTNTKMKPGDVNEDGEVNIKDLQIILRGVCEKLTLTERQVMIADVVKDGKVDIQDLRKVLRHVCGKVTEL